MAEENLQTARENLRISESLSQPSDQDGPRHQTTDASTPALNPQQPQKGKELCRFFNTLRGCKRGNACDHLHIPAEGPLVDARSMELCRFAGTPDGCHKPKCHYAHSAEEVTMAGGDGGDGRRR
jgi:hypothetical protein